MINYFTYEGNNAKVNNVVSKCNETLNSDEFYNRIKSKDGGYLYSNCSGAVIANSIRMFRIPITIELYKSKNPWTKANGYFTPSKPHTVHLNTRKLGRSNGSIGATAIHELVHAVDAKEGQLEFGHKDNKHTPEKEDSAPFYIDNLAESMITGIPMEKLDIRTRQENFNIKYVPVWYKRIFMPWKWF